MKPVDAHCHLDFEQFDDDRDEVISNAKHKLEFIVNAGSNLDHNRAALELGQKYPDFVIPTLGLHPCYTDDFDQLEEVKQQIHEQDPVAIGEIGLDHYHVEEKALRERQEEVFRELLQLAEELQKPVVIHSRDAERKAVEILKEYDLPDVMLHCFNGTPGLAEEAVEKEMTVGVTTQVLYSTRVQNIVKTLEIENILLETDSPYLYQGERNEPVNVVESTEKIAQLTSISTEKVSETTTKNARRFFN
jgi:TatD DNase family protein